MNERATGSHWREEQNDFSRGKVYESSTQALPPSWVSHSSRTKFPQSHWGAISRNGARRHAVNE
jgi:hypothetical protein